MLPVKSFSVSIFILKPDGDESKVLLLRRTGSLAGLWCQIAGGIKVGEKAWQTDICESLDSCQQLQTPRVSLRVKINEA